MAIVTTDETLFDNDNKIIFVEGSLLMTLR